MAADEFISANFVHVYCLRLFCQVVGSEDDERPGRLPTQISYHSLQRRSSNCQWVDCLQGDEFYTAVYNALIISSSISLN